MNFETFIQEKGWTEKYILHIEKKGQEIVSMKYVKPSQYDILSVLGNFDYRYFRKDDPIVNKIENGGCVLGRGGEKITHEDRKLEITFGLSGESYKPPTLISPRPKIEVKRLFSDGICGSVVGPSVPDGTISVQDNTFDDSMNIVLKEIPFEEIFKAMFDKSIIFKFDYTKEVERLKLQKGITT